MCDCCVGLLRELRRLRDGDDATSVFGNYHMSITDDEDEDEDTTQLVLMVIVVGSWQ